MREVIKVLGFMGGVVVVLGLVLWAWIAWGSEASAEADAPKADVSMVNKGLDFGRVFLPLASKKGQNMRRGLLRMHRLYGPWCWEYSRNDYVGCLSRIWFESRGNPWSRTKDMYLQEAGLTSVSWELAASLNKMGAGGDPCGDPEFAIAASAWSRREERRELLEVRPFWTPWLPRQFADNRIEAEYFMSVAGSVNDQKIAKLLKIADKAVRDKSRWKALNAKGIYLPEGVLANPHSWWKFIAWVRTVPDATMAEYLEGIKTSLWQFWFRVGRSSFGGWRVRGDFWTPNADGSPNYNWGEEPYWFPERTELDGSKAWDFPEPLYKMPKYEGWRDRCFLYGTRGWKRTWHEPKPKDRYRRGPSKGKLKYPTIEAWQAAHDEWWDQMQEERLLPSDADFAWWEIQIAKAGFVKPVEEGEAW